MYEYLTGCVILLGLWIGLYIKRKDLRPKMLLSSAICAPLGLTEPLFVPWYWNPGAVLTFNLLGFTFDVESLLFAFAIGGIAAVLYEEVLNKHMKKAREKRTATIRHVSAFFVVAALSFFTFRAVFREDYIYTVSASMALSALAIVMLRKDLLKEAAWGGALFAAVYVCFLVFFNTVLFPGFVANAYNAQHLLGVMVFGIPIEEAFFAWSFGSLWAPFYEDLYSYEVK